MNIIAPAFSTNFTKSLNKSIDRTAGMLYNNSVSDSFSFGQHSVQRSRRFNEIGNISRRELMNLDENRKGSYKENFLDKLIDLCNQAIDNTNAPLQKLEEIGKIIKSTPEKEKDKILNNDAKICFYNELVSYYMDTPNNLSTDKYRQDFKDILGILEDKFI